MVKNNITGKYAKLEEVYIQKILELSEKIGFSYIVWQEVFDNGVQVSPISVNFVLKAYIKQMYLGSSTYVVKWLEMFLLVKTN